MSNMFVLVDTASGALRQFIVASDDQADVQIGGPGTTIVGIDPEEIAGNPAGWLAAHYFDGLEVRARAVIEPTVSQFTIAADGVDEAVISGLPDPCVVSVSGVLEAAPVIVTGGEVIITCDQAGRLIVEIRAEPEYLFREVAIEVED